MRTTGYGWGCRELCGDETRDETRRNETTYRIIDHNQIPHIKHMRRKNKDQRLEQRLRRVPEHEREAEHDRRERDERRERVVPAEDEQADEDEDHERDGDEHRVELRDDG